MQHAVPKRYIPHLCNIYDPVKDKSMIPFLATK